MAITLVGVGAWSNGNNTDLSPALATHQEGDYLLVLASRRVAAHTLAIPSGYTELFNNAGDGTLSLFGKFAGASESAPLLDWSGGAAGQTVMAQVAAFRGVDPTDPIDTDPFKTYPANAQNIGPIDGFTPGSANAGVIVIGYKWRIWTSVDVLTGDGLSWSEISENSTALGDDAAAVWDLAVIAGAAVEITSKTFTVTGGAAGAINGMMLALRAASTGQAIATGQAAEVDTAQSIARAKARSVGQAAETDVAQPVAKAKAAAVGLAPEADAAQPITAVKVRGVGQAVGVDLAHPALPTKGRGAAQAAELDAAQPVSGSKVRALGLAAELDLAQPITPAKGRSTGQALEVDVAQPVTVRPLKIQVGQAIEQDLAQPTSPGKLRGIGEAAETDLGQPVGHAKLRGVGQALGVEVGQPITGAKARAIGEASELDLATATGGTKQRGIGQAIEVDAGQGASHPKTKGLGQATETALAQVIAAVRSRGVGQAIELDVAQLVGRAKLRGVLQATEFDIAQAVAVFVLVPEAEPSVIDEAELGLRALLQGRPGLAGVRLDLGDPGAHLLREHVWITEEPGGTQEWMVPGAGKATRQETFDLQVRVFVERSGADPTGARARAQVLAEEIELAIRADPTLLGAVWDAHVSQMRRDGGATESTRGFTATLLVTCRAFLS
ncbi:MAG: hypothetical protein ACRDH8_12970 [Actinomycetota bacterium]